eukprot:1366468-Amphidinium_carterae.1
MAKDQSSRVSMRVSMLQSLFRSSRMISTISALFSQLWHWLSFTVGYIKSGQSQDAHQSVQRESGSDQSIQIESECDQSESSLIENQLK